MSKYLAETTSLINKALASSGRNVEVALYKGLQHLFTRLDAWGDSQDTSKHAEIETAVRQEPVQELMLRDTDTSVEAIRQKRAQAVLAYVQFCQKRAGLGVSGRLRRTVGSWREQERSESVRRLLAKIVEAL